MSSLKILFILALAAALGGSVAALALGLQTEETTHDPSPAQAERLVDQADSALAATLAEAGTTSDLQTLNGMGLRADVRAAELRLLLVRAARLKHPRYREASR